MSEVQMAEPEVTEVETTTELDYKALYEETAKKLETVAAHKDKLYQETKQAKRAREEAALMAEKLAEEKAMKDGEFEKLWQTAKKEKEELLQNLHQLKQANRNEKLQISAMRIATELADGANAELLSEFVQRNLDKMADEAGGLSPDVLEAVKNEFKNNEKFKSLLRGSKAVGGGATGNTRSAQEDTKTIERDTFASWNPAKQMEFIRKGGRLTD